MERRVYVENFEDGPGGWMSIASNGTEGARRLEIENGVAISRSPWWVDYNHAPPGPGYLNLLFILHTRHGANFPALYHEVGGLNRFVSDRYSTNFTNARVTARLKGEVDLRGAQLVFLTVAKVGEKYVCHVLTGQPMEITPDWSEQTVTLVPDDEQWTCLGARHDRTETYDWGSIKPVLRDLNCDIMLVLFPVTVQPVAALDGNPHLLKAGEDYPLDPSVLPAGYVMLDEIRIEFTEDSGEVCEPPIWGLANHVVRSTNAS